MRIRPMKSTKLSWKIAILYMLLFSLVLIVLGGVVFFGVKYYLESQASVRLAEISQTITSSISESRDTDEILHHNEAVTAAEQDSTINIKIADDEGNVLINSDNFETPDMSEPDRRGRFETQDDIMTRNILVQKDGDVIARVQIAKNMKMSYDFLQTLLKWMIISDVAGVLISLLVGWLVSKNMLKPINKIMRMASEIGSTDLSKRIEVPPSDDELSQLAETFNEMLGRIEESFIKQGRFTADASHELRTPLTVIQGYAGILDRWGKNDEKIMQESIDAIKSETHNMTYIMERLLFLARGDNGSQIIQKEEFNVGEMMEELEKETRLLSPDRKISFQYENPVSLYADRKLIKQCLRAILDNSMKYTPQDGRIDMSCVMQADKIIFEITDTGMGIPAEDQKHIFERFFRVDKARERKTGGSGLGLSIVDWIVQAHDGRIGVDSKEGMGTTVTITLPAGR